MSRRPAGTLSVIENRVILEIRAMRTSPGEGFNTSLLENPARTAHHFILDSHGNVQLRLSTIAQELGIEMRTLERIFFDEYRQTMAECQVETRIAYSKSLLSIFPPTKISAVAAILGYNLVQDFNRFFKKYMHESPSEWSRKERTRIARAAAHTPLRMNRSGARLTVSAAHSRNVPISFCRLLRIGFCCFSGWEVSDSPHSWIRGDCAQRSTGCHAHHE